ncbi:hypothetical protein SEA_LATRETIUM_44 [Mycobacterium phage Latretium]|uniref:Uncharacterized protein n=1 Tax=Mycobacterium phage Kersh TaxID=1897501 RepID=A0A1D8EXS3_9CAUD|nr:hypothetical protein I5H52_gp042 [Mycobacterium phage Kersh]AOT26028.1 hypothetical protein SEA_KERSH_42 [Mycobacterium phage Kersh]QXO12844.1 hypothetical protein SEA_LATRETIUM_44 [Mycobacterium phage Latretium]
MGEPEDPTELAGVADADTMSSYAWSVEDPTINSELIDAGWQFLNAAMNTYPNCP